MTLQQWVFVAQIFASCGGLGALTVGIRIFWKKTKEIGHIYTVLTGLESEFKCNGGSSLRDSMNRIENQIDSINAQISSMNFAQYTVWDNTIDTPMFSADAKGKSTWVNKAYCDLLDKNPSDLLGTSWEVSVLQLEREKVREEWRRAISEERLFDMSYVMVADDGKRVPVRCKAFGSSKTGYLGFLTKEKFNVTDSISV